MNPAAWFSYHSYRIPSIGRYSDFSGRRCDETEERMELSRKEIREALARWNRAWDDHDLDGVMALFHDEILFDNWTGGKASGKEGLRKAWTPWFGKHGLNAIK